MKISLLEPLGVPESVICGLSEDLKKAGHEFVYYNSKTTDKNELAERSKDSDIIMIANNPYPDEVVESAKKLKMLAVAFTGIDHVGLSACKKNGITVCNCAGYSNESVAELTVGLAIGVLRHIRQGDSAARTGGTSAGLVGGELRGRTVGIVGTGRIGIRTAQLFGAFGAKLLGYARHESDKAKAAGIRFTSLENLLQNSDIVSLHLPLTAQTRKSFGEKQFAQMKSGAVFLNCARGAIVDNEALAEALNSGKLAGAGIDVFDMEPPLPKDYPLLQAKNILLTPHTAFLSQESMLSRAKIEFDNVKAYLSGSPKNVCKIE